MRFFAKAIAILFWLGIPLLSVAQPVIIGANTNDMAIFDYNADNLGDFPWSTSSPGELLGENGPDGYEHRYILPFAPNAEQRAALANAQSVSLTLQLLRATNVAGCKVDIYGLADRTVEVPTKADFETAAAIVFFGAFAGESALGSYSFDVTAFARAEAKRSPASVIMFRLQVAPDVPNGDGTFNQYMVASANSATPAWRPTLTVLQGSGPIVANIESIGEEVTISWSGGKGPYQVERVTNLRDPNWVPITTTEGTSVRITNADQRGFYRIRGQ